MGWEEEVAQALNRTLDEERKRVEEAHRQQVDVELRRNEALYGFMGRVLESCRASAESLNRVLTHFRLALSAPVPISGVLIPPEAVSEFFILVDSSRSDAALRVSAEPPKGVRFEIGSLQRGPAGGGFRADGGALLEVAMDRSAGNWKPMRGRSVAEASGVAREALEVLMKRFRYEAPGA